ncbi:redox-sensing transcriptional repressor Rex [Fuchsiella alkaliacetigena]|uniref:redox-sensing transcriptional repressor Rex n=1 Tax=Fuchsiella alkaliacetigena TaxID=957042 RepID=UPI00200B57D5|nr:redox-sensing transcriptional repressor Rex [Fuchsiella alkaliacetigena]MCK8825004.1 redox-sensing transcriptional repressor Rex [Fuchsiella alkaliacetigena]
MKEEIRPTNTIERLPIYYRCLQRLAKSNIGVISSRELEEKIGIPSTQVRKDLSYYGNFGRRGVGYKVPLLLKHLRKILGLEKEWNIALVGAGALGQALINNRNFEKFGFNINYIFDADPKKIGNKLAGIQIKDVNNLEQIVKEQKIKMAIIAVPAKVAQEVANKLVKGGVSGIWNFAPVSIKVPYDVQLKNENLSIGLIGLAYYLKHES